MQFSFDETEWDPRQKSLRLETPEEPFSLDDESSPMGIAEVDDGFTEEPDLTIDEDRRPASGSLETDDDAEEEDDDEEYEVGTRGAAAGRRALVHDEEEESAEASPPVADRKMKARPALTPLFAFFLVVIGVYFVIARSMITDHELADRMVSALPLVGSSLGSDRLLFRKIALADVESSVVYTKEGKELMVISGRAINTASRPLRDVQIQASLVDANDHPLRTESTTPGGVLSMRMLSALTLRELDTLRKVEPAKRLTILPGESAPFSLLFPEPPAGVAGYISKVTAAQRQT